jgi:hypothetical protein
MSVGQRLSAYVRHGGNFYPARHWTELSRFAIGDERDPRGLFRLADDVWEAWPYAEAGRPTTAANYRFYFTRLCSFLKLYVKWYCYERLLVSADTSWSGAIAVVQRLRPADRFILERGFTSIDDIASRTAFEELWAATVIRPAADGEARRTEVVVSRPAQNRLFWLRLRSYFGAPHVVPPSPRTSKVPTEYADDRGKIIPEHVIKQLVNKLALHRDGLEPLNRFNHLRLCVVVLTICLGRRIGEVLSAPRGEGPDGPLTRAPARGGPKGGTLWFRYNPSKRGPSREVYISTEWEDVATYCVRELVKYSDEIRGRAHPKEAGLLILVSMANLTARKKAAEAAANATFTPVATGTDGPAVCGLGIQNLRLWLNGVKSGHTSDGVLKKWGITVDTRPESPIYELGLTFARHTRQSALALDPQISLIARQQDLNHNDTDAQFAYQHRLAESHEALLRKIGEGKMCGGGVKWLADLLGDKTAGYSEGSPTTMTPRWRVLVQNNPLFLQLNRVPCGYCVLPKGPGGCPKFLNCTGAEEGGCPCFVIDCDDARMLSELDAKARAERRRQLESAAAGRTVQAGKREVQARRAEGLRDEVLRRASAEMLAEVRRLQDEIAEEDLWGGD